MSGDFVRGSVFRLRHDPAARGREQRGRRFAVVVQNPDLLLSTVVVAPTSRSVRPATFRPVAVVDEEETFVLIEQLKAVDPSRLGDLVGVLTLAELDAVDGALVEVLGFS